MARLPASQRGRNVLSPVQPLTSPATPSSAGGCYPVNPVRPVRPARPCQPIPTLRFVILAARPLGAGPSRFSTPPALDLTDVGQVCSRKIRLSPYRCSELDPAEPSYVGPLSPSLDSRPAVVSLLYPKGPTSPRHPDLFYSLCLVPTHSKFTLVVP